MYQKDFENSITMRRIGAKFCGDGEVEKTGVRMGSKMTMGDGDHETCGSPMDAATVFAGDGDHETCGVPIDSTKRAATDGCSLDTLVDHFDQYVQTAGQHPVYQSREGTQLGSLS